MVSPDVGGIKRAQIFRELLAARVQWPVELIFAEKRRASGVVSSTGLVGDPAGQRVIIIDDLCATGATVLSAATMCRSAAALAVHVGVTHAPLSEGLDKMSRVAQKRHLPFRERALASMVDLMHQEHWKPGLLDQSLRHSPEHLPEQPGSVSSVQLAESAADSWGACSTGTL